MSLPWRRVGAPAHAGAPAAAPGPRRAPRAGRRRAPAAIRATAWIAALLPRAAQALGDRTGTRAASLAPAGGEPLSVAVKVLRRLPHASEPFTQGLEFTAGGQLVETSGDFPPGTGSFVRLLDPETGAEASRTSDGLRGQWGAMKGYFVEGITEVGGHWFASTFDDRLMLEYDENFRYLRSHPFPLEGWGLTHSLDGKAFLATNSSEYLMTLDPATFKAVDAKPVTCLGKAVPGVNELELVPDFLGLGAAVLGNIINTRLVLALDPATARCLAVFRLAGDGLEKEKRSEASGYHVANGIAFDRRRGTYFVTGKNWKYLFEVQLSAEPAPGGAREALAAHLASSGQPVYSHSGR